MIEYQYKLAVTVIEYGKQYSGDLFVSHDDRLALRFDGGFDCSLLHDITVVLPETPHEHISDRYDFADGMFGDRRPIMQKFRILLARTAWRVL